MKEICFVLILVALAKCQPWPTIDRPIFPTILNENGTLESISAEAIQMDVPLSYYPLMRVVDDFIVYYSDILKLNSTGGYNFVARIPWSNSDAYQGELDLHGEWVAGSRYHYTATPQGPVVYMNITFVRLAENGTIVDIQNPNVSSAFQEQFEFGRFHSDGSYIGVCGWSTYPAKSAAMHRYQLVNQIWTKTDSFIFSEKLKTAYFGNADQIKDQRSVFQFLGNHFVACDSSFVHVYELSSNATNPWFWSLKFSVPYITTWNTDSLVWNGDDAFLLGNPRQNQMYLLTRSANGTWSQTRSDLNLQLLSYGLLCVNNDTFLAGAPLSNQAVIVQRQPGNTWAIVGAILGVAPYDTAAALGINSKHVLLDGQGVIQQIPRCHVDPIDFECQSVIDSCNLENVGNTTIDARDFCTSKQLPECSSTVTTKVTGVSIVNGGYSFSYELRRFGAVPRTGTVTLQCIKSQPSDSPSANSNQPDTNSPNASSQPSKDHSVTSDSSSSVSRSLVGLISLAFLLSV